MPKRYWHTWRVDHPPLLVLTPVKNAKHLLRHYFATLRTLTYPRAAISLGFLEGDSTDGTYEALTELLPGLREDYPRVGLWKKDYGFQMPAGLPRWTPGAIQIERRAVLARSRNLLLSNALRDESWVLWLDVDVIHYPPNIVETMLGTGKSIVHPHCIQNKQSRPTFDLNAWRDKGNLRMQDLREEGDLVPLDAVGGTMLLIQADLHREGLIFPPFLYGGRNPLARDRHPCTSSEVGEIETEGLGLMAADMGHQCWGMPNLEIIHSNF
jgi:hypothetical protein